MAGQRERGAQLKRARAKALAKFRPRKGDRESYVFITPKGHVVTARTKEKVFAVYITRNGKKRPIAPKDIGGASAYKPHRVSTIQPAEALPRKRAARKYQAVFAQRFAPAVADTLTVRPVKGGRVLDFDDAARKFARDLSRRLGDLDPRSRRVFIIGVSATIRLPDGRLKTLHAIPVEFGAAFLQQYSAAALRSFARQKIWAVLGNELDAGFYVTTGSAAFIRARSYNRGADVSDWRQRMSKGELVLWRYASDYDERDKVQLVQMDFSVTQE